MIAACLAACLLCTPTRRPAPCQRLQDLSKSVQRFFPARETLEHAREDGRGVPTEGKQRVREGQADRCVRVSSGLWCTHVLVPPLEGGDDLPRAGRRPPVASRSSRPVTPCGCGFEVWPRPALPTSPSPVGAEGASKAHPLTRRPPRRRRRPPRRRPPHPPRPPQRRRRRRKRPRRSSCQPRG